MVLGGTVGSIVPRVRVAAGCLAVLTEMVLAAGAEASTEANSSDYPNNGD